MLWLAGIEDTAIGVPIRHSGRTLDEYELTEHDRRYREDLDLAASLGVDGIRYGVPWYRVNPQPGVLRWELVDPVIEYAHGLGLTLVIDLVHYGVPGWLDGGFVDPDYPGAIEDYAGSFAQRYRRDVRCYTPLNEPLVTATFCGETGGWPPYLTGARGWTAVTLGVAKGIQRSVAAIRSAAPDVTIVHVEAAKTVWSDSPTLAEMVALERARAWLPTDLVTGGVHERHPMWDWLVANGAAPESLAAFIRDAVDLDVMGVNYYPQYSVREFLAREGQVVQVAGGGTADDLTATLKAFADRYGRPVAVTETSYDGDDEAREAWLRESVAATLEAASNPTDVWAYTWWPLFDFVDWGIAAGDHPLEDFVVRRDVEGTETVVTNTRSDDTAVADPGIARWLRPMGLWRLEPSPHGLIRTETPVADVMRRIIEASDQGSAPESEGARVPAQ